MINSLRYNITFSSTGKNFSQTINFKPGLTVISGANEKGKSLILEMIEYAWFGSSALRGQASDYTTIEVDMEWETKGEKHTVSRHGSIQKLDKVKAVGANAVNKEILKILGINMDVFRIANSAKQGELDKLTARMRATERRKMVDEVIGLDQLETVERLCKSEANANKRLRDDLAKRLVEPVAPDEPKDYIPSTDLEDQYKDQLRVEAERNQLVKLAKPVMPEEPVKPDYDEDVEEYEEVRKAKDAERIGIERTLRSIPPATYSRQDIDYAVAFYAQQARGPRPTLTVTQIDDFLQDWTDLDRATETVECPECHVCFVPGGETIDYIPPVPEWSREELREQNQYHIRWEDFDGELLEAEPVVSQHALSVAMDGLSQAGLREELLNDLASIPQYESKEDQLRLKLDYEKKMISYTNFLDRYVEELTLWSDAQEKLATLPQPDPDLENKLRSSQTYEEQLRRYDVEKIAFDKTNVELSELNLTVEDYTTGSEALKFVRSQVKQHLVPSLNKVASHLLSEMTNGQRTKIVVDEDFEVSVDGQPVRTLSGSGISVVNLALRIALGQVLTQRIVPVFLADEIDHDMDADRAKATHEAIRSLTKTIKQIIVVSHKQMDGDNYIGV